MDNISLYYGIVPIKQYNEKHPRVVVFCVLLTWGVNIHLSKLFVGHDFDIPKETPTEETTSAVVKDGSRRWQDTNVWVFRGNSSFGPVKKLWSAWLFLSSLDPCYVLILYVFVVKQKSTWELPEARWYGYGLIRVSDFWDCIGYSSIFTLNILCITVFCCPSQVVSWNSSIQEYALMVITFTCFLKSRRMSCHTWAVKHTLVVWVNEVVGHTSIPTNKYNGMGQRLMLCGSFGPVLNSFHSVGEDS